VILGVGIDLVDVGRMDRILHSRWAARFIARVFSEEEIAVSENSPRPAQSYAARFAAKEALVKALGTGFSRGIMPGHILVRGGERTRPRIELTSAALVQARLLQVGEIHVSLSHTPVTACAVVMVEKQD